MYGKRWFSFLRIFILCCAAPYSIICYPSDYIKIRAKWIKKLYNLFVARYVIQYYAAEDQDPSFAYSVQSSLSRHSVRSRYNLDSPIASLCSLDFITVELCVSFSKRKKEQTMIQKGRNYTVQCSLDPTPLIQTWTVSNKIYIWEEIVW